MTAYYEPFNERCWFDPPRVATASIQPTGMLDDIGVSMKDLRYLVILLDWSGSVKTC